MAKTIREQFIDAREAPLRAMANERIEKSLNALVRDFPQQTAAEIEKARKGGSAGMISVQVYPDYEAITLKDVAQLPSFAALHKLCASPAVDVCVTLTETPATTERGYEAGKCFGFLVQLDKPYSKSNYKPVEPRGAKPGNPAP